MFRHAFSLVVVTTAFFCIGVRFAVAQYPGYGAYDTDPYRTRLHDYGPGYYGGLGFETRDRSYYIDEYGREYHEGGAAPPRPSGPAIFGDPRANDN